MLPVGDSDLNKGMSPTNGKYMAFFPHCNNLFKKINFLKQK